ncbi:hypothetical protein H6P81_011402 [Aristolochia fimbriata]|uniref:Uncharacterized protein n=1 Tax=Aristolochia fimbriata TaxID=158543 RepID=A0AAV7EUX2_ARIFI|nr:hypothetical protein H6P81_011402 [Aristolochia fimbriata]
MNSLARAGGSDPMLRPSEVKVSMQRSVFNYHRVLCSDVTAYCLLNHVGKSVQRLRARQEDEEGHKHKQRKIAPRYIYEPVTAIWSVSYGAVAPSWQQISTCSILEG